MPLYSEGNYLKKMNTDVCDPIISNKTPFLLPGDAGSTGSPAVVFPHGGLQ
jgi:hypothetical protein